LTWDGYSFFYKPPRYSWLTGLTYKLIGIGEFAARIRAARFGFDVPVLTSSLAGASDPGSGCWGVLLPLAGYPAGMMVHPSISGDIASIAISSCTGMSTATRSSMGSKFWRSTTAGS